MNIQKSDLLLIQRALMCYRVDQTEITIGNGGLTDEQKENYNKITNVMDIVSQLYNTEEKFFVHYIT